MAGVVTNSIWDKVSSMGVNTTFTGPELRHSFQKVPSSVFYNRISYLMKIGVVEKTGSWSPDNYVVYRVKNASMKPSRLHYFTNGKSHSHRKTPVIIDVSPAKDKSTSLVGAIDRMATELNDMLKIARDNVLTNHSTKDLLDEVARRTSIS